MRYIEEEKESEKKKSLFFKGGGEKSYSPCLSCVKTYVRHLPYYLIYYFH